MVPEMKQKTLAHSPAFDPNSAASADAGIFGLPNTAPHDETSAAIVLLPIGWEATTSYGGGTSRGPSAILKASHQLDLFDGEVEKPYEAGLHMLAERMDVHTWNEAAKTAVINTTVDGADPAPANELSARLNQWVEAETTRLLECGKTVGIIGGDHSVPYGAYRAFAKRGNRFGILHFDAHHDLREAYQGFTHSHASIMYNALNDIPQISKLVQVGIRDFSENEAHFARAQGKRVTVHYDHVLARRKHEGTTWQAIAKDIVSALPEQVWISFDIDGLDPELCPHTGTPVPGGLSFHEANAILRELARSGRKIVGFDLVEVSPSDDLSNEWDANVGMRLLYKMIAWTLVSQGKAKELKDS